METPPPVAESAPETPPVPTSSLAGRLTNVFAAPGDVFDEVRVTRPCTANWLAPALLLILVGWIGSWLVFSQPAIQQQLREVRAKALDQQIARMKVSEAQAEQIRKSTENIAEISTKVAMFGGPVIGAFAIPFLWGLIIWLVGTKILHGNFSYMKGVEVAGLANMVLLLESIVKTLLMIVTSNIFASPSLVLLVKEFDPQNPVHSLLALVNVLVFWMLAVRAVGMARLSGATFARAAAWVFGIWIGYNGLLLGFGFGVQALMKR